jgi:putative (di)nucleoside polyphosphate hydrolase
MTDLIDSQGFRSNVGIILMRGSGEVFLGRRARGRGGWQFPQGGMRQGEELEQALFRELHEETGLTHEHVIVVGRTERWLSYRLPARYVRRDSQPLCIGQKQRWFLLRLQREDVQFELAASSEPEFDRWRWTSYWEPIREVVYFKQAVYVQALEELAPLAFPQGAPAAPEWLARIRGNDEQSGKPTRGNST